MDYKQYLTADYLVPAAGTVAGFLFMGPVGAIGGGLASLAAVKVYQGSQEATPPAGGKGTKGDAQAADLKAKGIPDARDYIGKDGTFDSDAYAKALDAWGKQVKSNVIDMVKGK